MKTIMLLIGLLSLCVVTFTAFAKTTNERLRLAKQIKEDNTQINLNVQMFASKMKVHKVVLNFDGKPEYIVQGTFNDFCGGSNCSFLVYKKVGSTFVNIGGEGVEGQAYNIGRTKTNGYLDIVAARSAFGGGGTVI